MMKNELVESVTSPTLIFSKVLTPEQINQQVDLSGEDYRFVRIFERGNGQNHFYVFSGIMSFFPVKQKSRHLSKANGCSLSSCRIFSGHGERNIYSAGEQEYAAFAEK